MSLSYVIQATASSDCMAFKSPVGYSIELFTAYAVAYVHSNFDGSFQVTLMFFYKKVGDLKYLMV